MLVNALINLSPRQTKFALKEANMFPNKLKNHFDRHTFMCFQQEKHWFQNHTCASNLGWCTLGNKSLQHNTLLLQTSSCEKENFSENIVQT